MPKDFKYSSAPLVEVIAEFRWELQEISFAPGTALDPHFDAFAESVESALNDMGYTHSESLKPTNVPIELFPNKPVRRFRNGPNQWPVIQYGPGMMSVNLVPPYDGWDSFRPLIREALDLWLNSYPLSDQLSRFRLRYIDAFTSKFGYENYPDFVQNDLNLEVGLPETIEENSQKVSARVEFQIPVMDEYESIGKIKVSPGKSSGEPAGIVDFSIECFGDQIPKQPSDICSWFDSSHMRLRNWFDSICTNEMKQKFGERIEIPE